ncbi:1-phosphofructokinase, partial [Microbispora rosea]
LAAGARGATALAEGLAWAGAAVGLPGSRMPGPADIDRTNVRIGPPDPARPLTPPPRPAPGGV